MDQIQISCEHEWEILADDLYAAGPVEYCPKCHAVKMPWYRDNEIGRLERFGALIDFELWYANRCRGMIPPMQLTDVENRAYWDDRLGKNI